MMCTSQSNPHRSTNLETLDRLAQALLVKVPSSASASTVEEAPEDPLESLSSSRQSAHLTFLGIFDSITLAKKQVSPSSNFNHNNANADNHQDGNESEDTIMLDGAEDEIDASWSDFTKTDPLPEVRHGSCTRRSGVRRGHHGATESTKMMVVLTKCNDGPSSSVAALQDAVPKLSSPPAA